MRKLGRRLQASLCERLVENFAISITYSAADDRHNDLGIRHLFIGHCWQVLRQQRDIGQFADA